VHIIDRSCIFATIHIYRNTRIKLQHVCVSSIVANLGVQLERQHTGEDAEDGVGDQREVLRQQTLDIPAVQQ